MADDKPKSRAYLKAAEGRVTYYLAPDLVKAVKHAAVDRGVTASDVVIVALREHFAQTPPPGYTPPAGESGKARADRTQAQAVNRAQDLKRQGLTQERIASTLNREGYVTKRGRKWTAVNVGRMMRGEV